MMPHTGETTGNGNRRGPAWAARIGRAVAVAIGIATLAAAGVAFGDDLDQDGLLWAPYLEWSLSAPSQDGNPFDVSAQATFTHEPSGATVTSGMFYDGDGVWKFRFSGTQLGRWTFETSSPIESLHGRRGQVRIAPNPDPDVRGFMIAHASQFTRQGPEEHDLEAIVPNVWMNYRLWGNHDSHGWTDIASTFADAVMVNAFLDDAEAHGMNGIQGIIANQWFTMNVGPWDRIDNENPDMDTFRALEAAIVQAHQRGMFVHIWAWGDEQRRWTPRGLTGGINGEADRRIQRYIAARLGPLPGWSMSYGFDLNEWVRTEQVAQWVEYLQEHMGWPRLLGARQADSFVPPPNTTYLSHDARLSEQFYDHVVALLEYAQGRPLWLERRYSWMRDEVWDMDTTRRAMWQFAMAGGAGAIWGFYPPGSSIHHDSAYDGAQMRLHRDFWRKHAVVDMERAPGLSQGAWALQKNGERFIFYQEDTDILRMDLSGAAGPLQAVAVDTRQADGVVEIGEAPAGEFHWQAPHRSDWAISIRATP